uniref:SCAN box domain-containing protein n=1 Tax=Gadus morhua TaxID=8049 RepID=A0A8C4ZWY5_GADMO
MYCCTLSRSETGWLRSRKTLERVRGLNGKRSAKWIKPDRKTVEEIGELLNLEQYLRSLAPDVRAWQAVKLVEAFLAVRPGKKALRFQSFNRSPAGGKSAGFGMGVGPRGSGQSRTVPRQKGMCSVSRSGQGWTGHLAHQASSRWAVDPMWAGPVRYVSFFSLSLNSLQLGRPIGYRGLAVCCQHRHILLVYVCHCQSIMG